MLKSSPSRDLHFAAPRALLDEASEIAVANNMKLQDFVRGAIRNAVRAAKATPTVDPIATTAPFSTMTVVPAEHVVALTQQAASTALETVLPTMMAGLAAIVEGMLQPIRDALHLVEPMEVPRSITDSLGVATGVDQ